MFAIAAAIVFGLALLFDLADVSSDAFNTSTLTTLGLLLVALHLAGLGTSAHTNLRSGWNSRRRTRR